MNTLFSYITIKTETQDLEPRNCELTVYHFRGHDSLSLAALNGIVLWGATDRTGTEYCVPLAFESDILSELEGIVSPEMIMI